LRQAQKVSFLIFLISSVSVMHLSLREYRKKLVLNQDILISKNIIIFLVLNLKNGSFIKIDI